MGVGNVFDPYVAILDGKRFELAASDDAPLLGQDGVASVIAPADGTYVIQVRDSAYGGTRLPLSAARRHVSPADGGGARAAARLGEEVEVRFLGDPAGEITQKIKLPAEPDPKFGSSPRTRRHQLPRRFRFACQRIRAT